MNLLVCLKQTLDTEHRYPDYLDDSMRVDRGSVGQIINVFDSYALEIASRLKDRSENTVLSVLTMGSDSAKTVLKEALAISADQAYHISDGSWAGLDAPATAKVIAAFVRMIEAEAGTFDVIFCGKLSTDGETSAVPAGIAEELGRPLIASSFEVEANGRRLAAKREIKGGYETLETDMPCIVTCVKPEGGFKFPTIKRKLAANRAEIPVISSERVDIRVASATKVLDIYKPQRTGKCELFNGEALEESAKQLVERLYADSVI